MNIMCHANADADSAHVNADKADVDAVQAYKLS